MENVYAIDGITPVVEPSAFVHPTAVVIGDVVIGKNCYVGPNVSLRGDLGQIFMKNGSNMQDGCIAHTFAGGQTVLEEFANVGHGAVLHGCHLGKGVLIGMNAVIMDDAEIGDFAFVAGIPAKVIAKVNEEELAWKAEGDEDYQQIIKRSHATLKRVNPLSDSEKIRHPRIKIKGIPPLHRIKT